MKQLTISELEKGQRIDKYVKKYLNNAPLSFIEKLFRKKDVKINGKRVKKNEIINAGDIVQIYVTDGQLEDFAKKKSLAPTNFPETIVYEDENILILNKPKGLLVHEDDKEKVRTLANQVLSYLSSKGEYDSINVNAFTPAPAHRLDRNTSGLVCFAKNLESLQCLEELFKNKDQIEKHYLALVAGAFSGSGEINKPLRKDANEGLVKIASINDGGKPSITKYTVIKTFADYSLVDLNLITGRTHQIRVHMASIDHPVIGDGKYGNFQANRIFNEEFNYNSQFLHAYKIIFKKISGKLSYLSGKEFSHPLNKKEQDILNSLN